MRALTLWRPWPYALFHTPGELAKRIENRPWKPWPSIVGQTIALHAGLKWDADGAAFIRETLFPGWIGTPSGPGWTAEGIVGTARVTRWFAYPLDHLLPGLPPSANIPPGQERWCFGPYCWVLEDVRALAEPIPCRGMQGLWTVPRETEMSIWRSAPQACAICGRPATCVGEYEVTTGNSAPACDDCCGHGNEDGWCEQLAEAA